MSGMIVPMLGGPLDGREFHLRSGIRNQEALYEAGDWGAGSRDVHVYHSQGEPHPFTYQGIRPWKRDIEAVLPLIHAAPAS